MTALNEAIAAHQRGDFTEALRAYDAVLACEPSNPDALALKGVLLTAMQAFPEAETLLLRAVALDPSTALFSIYLGDLYRATERWPDAANFYAKATEQAPRHAPAFFYLGLALSRCDRHDEALNAYRRAATLDPSLPEALDNVALTYQVLGKPEKAIDVYHELLRQTEQELDDEALLSGPESQIGKWHYHLSLLELRLGDYIHGFARYRSRFIGRPRPPYSAPLWRGEPLRDKKLLVYTEQGFGDTLMLARFLPLLKARNAQIYLQSEGPLVPLFKGWQGIDDMFGPQDPLPAFDYVASLFDLPHLMGTKIETIPLDIPYLPAPPPWVLEAPKRSLKIGVLWRGNPANGTDALRSLPLSLFSDVFKTKGASFYNLARDPSADEKRLLDSYGVSDLGTRFGNFADAAAGLSALDAVITCDTAFAHLAGGLGKPGFALIPFDPDWRWGFDQKRAAWYPSLRLLRQKKRGDWESALAQLPAFWSPSVFEAT